MIYDTGASGVIVFEGPVHALSLPIAQFSGIDIGFTDVGVGGSTTFEVSDDLHMSLGSFTQDPLRLVPSDPRAVLAAAKNLTRVVFRCRLRTRHEPSRRRELGCIGSCALIRMTDQG
jgi:hypothetical protein